MWEFIYTVGYIAHVGFIFLSCLTDEAKHIGTHREAANGDTYLFAILFYGFILGIAWPLVTPMFLWAMYTEKLKERRIYESTLIRKPAKPQSEPFPQPTSTPQQEQDFCKKGALAVGGSSYVAGFSEANPTTQGSEANDYEAPSKQDIKPKKRRKKSYEKSVIPDSEYKLLIEQMERNRRYKEQNPTTEFPAQGVGEQ